MTEDAAAGAAGPPVTVDLAIEDERWRHLPGAAPDRLADLLEPLVARTVAAVAGAGVDAAGTEVAAEVAVVLSDDRRVRDLNGQYRGIDRSTNVLSFALADDADAPPPPDGAPRLLGDVVLAYETVCAEARAADKPALDHLRHLVVHGVLHLLGHRHDAAAPAARMERLETAILGAAGIADPYRAGAPAAPDRGSPER